MSDNPPPPPDFNSAGFYWTKEFRLRPGWFGLVVEERVSHRDGGSSWKKRPGWQGPIYFKGSTDADRSAR